MTSTIVGLQLGLSNSSLNTLKLPANNAEEGKSGERVYVNAATGNLVIQRQDELLTGRGSDIGVIRTYNSQGVTDGDNNDNWRIGFYRQVKGLTGTVNTAGSTVVRVAEDGAELSYAYDVASGKYINKDGSGSYDTLSYAATQSQWTWVDGDSRVTETYNWASGTGTLSSQSDSNGLAVTYTYNAAGLLTRVSDAAGKNISLDYSGNLLTQVHTEESSTFGTVTSTRVRYNYDLSNRLSKITVDLSPGDNSIADNKTYVTDYKYDGTSNRVSGLVQTDGTSLSFIYDRSGRISQIKNAFGFSTLYSYDTVNRSTTATESSGLQTKYEYNTNGQLAKLTSYSSTGAITSQSFAYNGNDDVTSITDGEGNATVYQYDANGNQTRQRDAAGNTIERTYNSANQVLTETRYAVADPDGDGVQLPSAPLTTRNIYSASVGNRLRFVISAEGRVTEYRYNSNGLKNTEISYAGNNYTAAAVTETDLSNWVTGTADKARSRLTSYAYDFRGQLASSTSYGQTSSTGVGVTTTAATTYYSYSPAGQFLQIIAPNGGAAQKTVFSYDGLGRLLTSTDGLSQLTQYQYADSVSITEVTSTTKILPNGLRITNSYDRVGRLVSVMQGQSANSSLATTTYYYDSKGRLCMTQDPTGVRNWIFYDALNRQVAEIDGNGTLTETIYNKNNQVTQTIQYATAVNTSTISFGFTDAGPTGISTTSTLASLRPAVNVRDKKSWTIYDNAGRLIKTVNAVGSVTETRYDAAGRTISKKDYANPVSITTLGSAPQSNSVVPANNPVDDRVTRYVYDKDGLLVGTIDGEGYLTETVYDNASQPWQTRRYALKLSDATLTGATSTSDLTTLRPASSADDIREVSLYDDAGKVTGRIDGENYLSEYSYDLNGNLQQTTRYFTPLESTLIDSLNSNSDVSAIRPLITSQDQTNRSSFDALNRIDTSTNAESTTTKYIYDSGNRILSKTVALGTSDQRITGYGYDTRGRLISNTDAGNHTTIYNYDSADRLINSLDAFSNTTKYYYNADDQLVYTINALGEVQANSYNALEQKVSAIQYARAIDSATLGGLTGGLATDAVINTINAFRNVNEDSATTYDYFEDGSLKSETDALNNVTLYQYNAFGERSIVTSPASGGSSVSNTFTYDRRGLAHSTTADSGGLNSISSQDYDAFGRLITATDGGNHSLAYRYDKLGRQVTATDALNNITTTNYDPFNRVTTYTDGLQNVTTTTYDTASRTVTVSAAGVNVRTVYNRHGQTQTVVDGNGNTTEYHYDAFGNLDLTTLPSSRTIRQQFDATNRLSQSTDANGNTTEIVYDAANRVLTKTVGLGGLNLVTRYGYDPKGRQITVTDPNLTVTRYDYDLKGQLSLLTNDAGTGKLNLLTRYDYDAQGRQLKVTAANGGVSRYAYDHLGRVAYSADAAGAVTGYEYDSAGNVVKQTRYKNNVVPDTDPSLVLPNTSNDEVARQAYDANNRLSYKADSMGAVTKYEYDGNGNVIKKTMYATPISDNAELSSVAGNTTRDQVILNAYDALNRLIFTADGTRAVTGYRYDANNNIIAETRFATVLNPNTNDLSTVATNPADQVTRSGYDAMNRLIYQVDAVGAVTRFDYDGNGNVTKKTSYANGLMSGKAMSLASLQAGDQRVPLYPWLTGFTAGDAITMSVYFKGDSNQVAGQIVLDVYSPQGNYLTSYGSSLVYDNGDWQKITIARTLTQDCSLAVWIMGDQGIYKPAGQNGYYDNVVVSSARKGLVLNEQFETAAWGRGTLVQQQPGMLSANAISNLVVADMYRDKVEWSAYDANNRLRYAIDGNGAVTENQYDADGNIRIRTRYADPIPDSMRNAWGASSPSETMIASLLNAGNAANRSFLMEYDALGRLKQLTQPAAYAYDGINGSVTSPITKYTYDALGQVIRTEVSRVDASWLSTYHFYDQRGLETATIDASRFITKRSYDTFGNVSEMTEYATAVNSVSIDGYASPTTSNDDRTTRFSYYKNNLKETSTRVLVDYSEAVTAANLNSVSTTRGDLTSRYYYDSFGNQIKMIDAKGGTVYTYFDQANRIKAVTEPTRSTATQANFTGITEFRRTTFGNVSVQTERALGATSIGAYTYAVANNAEDRINRFSYDKLGHTVQTTDAVGAVRDLTYDALGNLVKQTSTALDSNGVVQKISKLFGYNPAGQLTSTTEPASVAAQTVKSLMQYNAFSELTARGIEGVGGVLSEYFDIDNSGRVWRSNSGDGVNKVMLYDLQGNMTAEIRSSTVDLKTRASAAAVNTMSDTRRIDNVWDALGRLTLQKQAQRSVNGINQRPQVTRDYDRWGNLIAVTDPVNASWVTWYTYNSNNQVKTENKPAASLLNYNLAAYSDQRPFTQYYYDYSGNLLAVRDARAYTSGKVYDSAGNVLQELNADGGIIAHRYNAFGNEVGRTDANGNVYSYQYNKLDQVIRTNRPLADFYYVDDSVFETSTPVVGYNGWDQTNEHEYERYWAGQYSDSEASPNTVLRYTRSVGVATGYDVIVDSDNTPAGAQLLTRSGNLPNGVSPIANHVGILRVESEYESDPDTKYSDGTSSIDAYYDQRGQKYSVMDAALQTINYRYDLRGNIVETTMPGSAPSTSGYDYFNRKTSETDANGNTQTWLYDYFGRLIGRTDLGGASYHYDYDYAGKLTHETNTRGRDVLTTYDGAGQITQLVDFVRTDGAENSKRTTRYNYDLAGHRTFESTLVEKWTYVFDGEGNTSTDIIDQHSLAYNSLGQLTSVTSGGSVLNYKYDLAGNRTYQNETFGGAIQESYSRYDAMNRQTLFNGVDAYGTLTDTKGMRVQYDLNGNRTLEIKGSGGWSQTQYIYDALGRITTQNAISYNYNNGSPISTITGSRSYRYDDADRIVAMDLDARDVDGNRKRQLSRYNNAGRLDAQAIVLGSTFGYGTESLVTSEYDAAGNLKNSVSYGTGYINQTHYDYTAYADSYKQSAISSSKTSRDPNHWSGGTGQVTLTGHSTLTYDVNGYLAKFYDDNANPLVRRRSFDNDANGNVLRKEVNGGWLRTVVVNGNVLGTYGNEVNEYGGFVSVRDFLTNDTITASVASGSQNVYRIRSGDTLQSIALAIYGDSQLWYLIADANGLRDNTPLRAGEALILPKQLGGVHNNSSTFKPFDTAKFIGITSPTVPGIATSGPNQCASIGFIILAVVVSIAITVAATAATVATLGALGIPAYTAAGVLIGAVFAGIGGGAAALASQGVMIAGGLKRDIDWKEVGISAITGFVTGGVTGTVGALSQRAMQSAKVAADAAKQLARMPSGIMSLAPEIAPKVALPFSVRLMGASVATVKAAQGGAARAGQIGLLAGRSLAIAAADAGADAAAQGISVAVGLQKKFDWTQTMTAGIAGLGAGFGSTLGSAEKAVLGEAASDAKKSLLKNMVTKAGISVGLGALGNIAGQGADMANEKQVGFDWRNFGLNVAGSAAGGLLKGVGAKYMKANTARLAYADIVADSLGTAMGFALAFESGSKKYTQSTDTLMYKSSMSALTTGSFRMGRGDFARA